MRARTHRRLCFASSLVLLGACAGRYGGELAREPSGPHQAIYEGLCLDWRVARVHAPIVPAPWAVLELEIGNRCGEAVLLDLRRARVTAQDEEQGPSRPLVRHDPRGEIVPALLDGYGRMRERVAYRAQVDDPSAEAPAIVCVLAAGAARARDAPPEPICLRAIAQ